MSIRQIIGMMSGTSLDGVDASWMETDGEQHNVQRAFAFVPYADTEKDILSQATQAAITWNFIGPRPNIMALAEDIIERRHAEAARKLMNEMNTKPDFIGFHGQTVLHRAATHDIPGQTLQIGDARNLARNLDIGVVHDFRSADVAAGGQGAPLAPGYHEALMGDAPLPWAVLNIGGVANITLKTAPGDLSATDTGPGNGPLDSWVSSCGLGQADIDGKISRRGTPDIALIERWLKRSFFKRQPPVSADRWDFDVLEDIQEAELSPQDGAATLIGFTAFGVKAALQKFQASPHDIIVCGGGRHNPVMMAALTEVCGVSIVTAEAMGWDGDALEAQAFAWLAARHLDKKPLSWPGTTAVNSPTLGGRFASN